MNVERTATEAINCKTEANSFAAGQGRYSQTALLSKIYLARVRLIHTALRFAAAALQDDDTQLLNLGGGLDSSYELYFPSQFIVDLPRTLSNITNGTPTSTTKYIECDLSNIAKLEELLLANGFDFKKKTVVLAECVFSYMNGSAVDAILKWLAIRLDVALFVGYDPICGFDKRNSRSRSLSRSMVERFLFRKAPLLSVLQSTTEINTRMLESNWNFGRAFTISHAMQLLLPGTDRNLYVQGELFDEFASIQTIMNLYCLNLACTDGLLFRRWLENLELNATLERSKESSFARLQSLNARIITLDTSLSSLEHVLKRRSYFNNHEKAKKTSESGEVAIHLMTPEEAEAAAALYLESFLLHSTMDKSVKKYIKSSSKQILGLKIKSSIEDNSQESSTGMNHIVWVAQKSIDKCIVGTVGIKKWKQKQMKDGDTAIRFEIVHFCVSKDCRNSGIGTQLLLTALNYCEANGAHEIHLTVLSSFESARRLYSSYGFCESGVDTISPNCTMIHMIRKC